MAKRRDTEYKEAVADADARIHDIDRHRCQYTIDGMRCTALGVMCDSAVWDPNVKDPYRHWLCLTHYRLRGDHVGSRAALHDIAAHPPKPKPDWREKMMEDHGLGELQAAWRDMGEEEKRALIKETIRKASAFVRPPTPKQEKPQGHTVFIDPASRESQLDAAYRAMTPAEREAYEGSRMIG